MYLKAVSWDQFNFSIFPFPGIFPARYILAVLGSIGFAIVYGLKVNLSVAMVGMLNHTAINLTLESKSEHKNVNASVMQPSGDEECVAPGGSGNVTVSIC